MSRRIETPDYPAEKYPELSREDREILQRLANSRRAVAELRRSKNPELHQ